ncbi:MAG: Ig-like domain-containing protein [Deltaproteobacteria bacterium]|nr:Ig-like domain-containing protein [Deltaproteobacteria bacterium]
MVLKSRISGILLLSFVLIAIVGCGSLVSTPVATLVLPNTQRSALSQIQLVFSFAVDPATATTSNVKVIQNGDTTSTNLISSISLDATNTTMTLNLSINYACNTTSRTKYNVTTTADLKSASGSHPSQPFSGYFTTADQGFGDSAVIGISTGCWNATSGVDDDGGVVINEEIINANTTNAGKLTIQGDPDADLTGDNDTVPDILGPSDNDSNIGINETAYGVTVKLDTASGLSVDDEEAMRIVFVDVANVNYGLLIYPDIFGYRTIMIIGGNPTLGTTKTIVCRNCFVSSPVYTCLLRDKDGQVIAGIDAGGTGTFTPVDNSIFTTTSSGAMRTQPQLLHKNGTVPSMTIDWIRYNLDTTIDVAGTSDALASAALASYCPPISAVQ